MLADEQFVAEFIAKMDKFTGPIGSGVSELSQLNSELERTGKMTDDMAKRYNKATDKVAKSNVGLKRMGGNYKAVGVSAEGAGKSADQFGKSQQGIISGRYALYDVAAAYAAVSAALLAVSIGAVKVSSEFQSAYANVARTSNSSVEQLGTLRKELADLSTQIPESFTDLSRIATLGNQLGIAGKDVGTFTKVVAEFSAATGISIEEASLAFGQLGNLLGVTADQYSNLGSSIALVGVNSAATESQIVAVAREIAPIARDAGFTADQVVGLSGALASLRVPAQRSRSTLLRFFETLNTASVNGGKQFQDFAHVVGVSVEKLQQMVRGGEGADIFKRFIETLSTKDTVDITQSLNNLGIASLRLSPTVRALANNTELMNSTFADGAKGFSENTELARQYGIVVATLESQWKLFVNSVNQAIDTLTSGSVDGLAGLLSVLTNVVTQFTAFAQNPIVQRFAQIGLVITAVTGAFLAFRVASILSTASVYALLAAQERLGATGAVGGIRGLIRAFGGYTIGADGATVATTGLAGALRLLGRVVVIGAVISAATELIFNFGESMQFVTGIVSGFIDAIVGAERALAGMLSAAGAAYSSIGGLYAGVGEAYSKAGAGLSRFADAQRYVQKGMNGWAKSLTPATKASDAFSGAAVNGAGAAGDFADGLNGPGGVGGAAKGAAKAVRTLVDYASDLSGVFSRAFDIRYGSQLGLDAITTAWSDLNDEMDKYRRKVAELTADRSVKEYFLGIANAYGDTLRAGTLNSDIADLNSQIADATGKSSTELSGNSKAAITNRKRLTDLSKTYEDYITALASSGASQDTLNQAVADSRAEFTNQALALGYSNQQLQPYIASFGDLARIIDTVPRNITVNANVDPAMQALNEYAAKLRSVSGGTYGGGHIVAPTVDPPRVLIDPFDHAKYQQAFRLGRIPAEVYHKYVYGYKKGGYTGDGGTSAPAGVVHGREFVFDAKATQNAGVGNLYAMQRALQAGRGYQQGGYVAPVRSAPAASGGNVFVLDMAQYRGLLEAGNVTVQVGDQTVANATNGANKTYASLGRG